MNRITVMTIGMNEVITRVPGSGALAHLGCIADR